MALVVSAQSSAQERVVVKQFDADQELFAARCLKCHGDGGTGTFMLARRIGKDKALLAERTDLQAEYVRFVVRNGIVSMPAITRVEVTDDELAAIVRYLTRPRS
jgi:mono/diheme cytochrome c family protein